MEEEYSISKLESQYSIISEINDISAYDNEKVYNI